MLGAVAFAERGAEHMKSLGLSHYALAMGAASALLAGCGGSQQIGQTASQQLQGPRAWFP